ncbi:MAG TPA: hypothetical protein VMU41_11740, partial [Candidatus Binataceae bacterium]|nr:hypothetical protein [Candidatus Binataceae bacterium]
LEVLRRPFDSAGLDPPPLFVAQPKRVLAHDPLAMQSEAATGNDSDVAIVERMVSKSGKATCSGCRRAPAIY